MPEITGHLRPLSQDVADAAMEMAAMLSTRRSHRAATLSPAVNDLLYRGLRGWGLAQVRLARMSKKPPAPEIAALLSIAWAALADQLRASHVVVDEAVSAAKLIAMRASPGHKPAGTSSKKSSQMQGAAQAAAGFVNALLRKTIADPDACVQDLEDPRARWNAPTWWIERIKRDWPEHAEEILDALRIKGRLTVRIHTHSGLTPEAYLNMLSEQGLNGTQVGPQAVVIEPPLPVDKIPGFANGLVSIQDAAAQNICGIFDGLAKEKSWGDAASVQILDACAAPGGKSTALAQQYAATIWAMDSSKERLAALSRDLPRHAARLKGSIRPLVADVTDPSSWPAEMPQQFDAIVLDAPCSASGVVRRHPEIPWRRSPQGLTDVADIQRRMLDLLWGRLKPGGELAFVTCSVFRDEGERQQEAFLARTADARLLPSVARVWPCDDLGQGKSQDGFFFSLFKKLAPSHDPLPDVRTACDAGDKPASRTG